MMVEPKDWKDRELEELLVSAVQKLGADAFEEVYSYLKSARQQKASEAEVRAALEKVVPRASDCFEVDQLLYFEKLIAMGEGAHH
ncbi:Serine/threonine-protein kinase Nek11 [Camelus dromedarius]|uniref:Serine/threonine-protein kinase Nek11 n=1 Tax=Camelus dromedarius TaxID=9838 RepID=A0A5N4EJU9_CAMDR|nr:Serine/threonine-protein kinase Nek11 [Camelus dromedarius]